ncbi:MAG: YHS domain-containing protein [Terriglobales bacterium]
MEALVYFVLWAGLIFLMMRFGCGAHVMGHGHERHGAGDKNALRSFERRRWVPPKTDIDPVCGKIVHTDQAKSSVHDGTVYYFCSRECRERFEVAPHVYVGPNANQQSKQKDHAHG